MRRSGLAPYVPIFIFFELIVLEYQPWMTYSRWLFGWAVAIVFVFFALHQEKALDLKVRKGWLITHIVLFVTFLFWLTNSNDLKQVWGHGNVRLVAIPLRFAVGVSALLTFFEVKPFYYRLKERPYLPALLVVSFVAPFSGLPFFWRRLASASGQASVFLMKAVGVSAKAALANFPPYSLYILHKDFNIEVAFGCSGIEGFCLFISVLSAAAMLDWKTFGKGTYFELLLIGFLYMFGLNVLRITAFFLFAVTISQNAGGSVAFWAIDLFHSNVGWILYIVGIGVFFSLFYLRRGHRATVHGSF